MFCDFWGATTVSIGVISKIRAHSSERFDSWIHDQIEVLISRNLFTTTKATAQ